MFHDEALQHYRAFKAINEDSFEAFLTAITELKMDPIIVRDWQRSSREHKEVPPCSDLLDFINLQAYDSENSLRDVVKKPPQAYTDK